MNRIIQTKQPGTLYALTASYMCERFGHYVLRTLLVLYMIQRLIMPTEDAYSTFAAFTALMYVSPLLGGKFIDRNFEHDQASLIGGLLLAAGIFSVGFFSEPFLNMSLSLIICGNGFYAPSIIASLGQSYQHNDPRRERGFITMYSAINLSAVIAALSAPVIIWYAGWQAAFYSAAGVTLFGTCALYLSRRLKGNIKKIPKQQLLEFMIFLISGIMVFTMLLHSTAMSVTFMISLSSILIIYTFTNIYATNILQRKELFLCLALTMFSIICFTLTQQSAMSLMLFAENNVARVLNGYSIPTFYFMTLNPFFIIILSPLLSLLWRQLNKSGNNPSITDKLAVGTILLGTGFLILTIGIEHSHSQNSKIGIYWMIASYLFQALGELLVFPTGFAMITELAPRQMMGFMIGVWYFMIAISNWLPGFIANHTVTLKHPATHHHTSIAMTAYANVFGSLGFIAVSAGLILILLPSIFNMVLKRQPH